MRHQRISPFSIVCNSHVISARFPNTLSHESVGLWSIGMPTRPISLPLQPGLELTESARAWKVWWETWTRPRLYADPVIIEMLNRVDADVMGATEFSVQLISIAGAKPKTSRMLMKPCKKNGGERESESECVKRLERRSLIPLLSFHHSTQWRWSD